MRLLVDSSSANEPIDAWSKQLFAAILDEEAQALTHIKPELERLRAAVDALQTRGN